MGSVLNVKPSLSRVDVLCEVNDTSTVVPRNSIVEANQSGVSGAGMLCALGLRGEGAGDNLSPSLSRISFSLRCVIFLNQAAGPLSKHTTL